MEESVAQAALFGSERHAGAQTAHLRQVEEGLELSEGLADDPVCCLFIGYPAL